VAHLHARQVPEQRTVGMQRALRRARGAGGVDDDRRIVRARVRRGEVGGLMGHAGGEVNRARPALGRPDVTEIGQLGADRGELARALGIGDDRGCAGILEPILQRLRPEQHEERDRDGPQLEGGDVGDRGDRRLRQQDADPIPAVDAVRGEQVGEPVGLVAQLGEADPGIAPILPNIEEGELVRLKGCPFVADIVADIVGLRDSPFEARPELLVGLGIRQHRREEARSVGAPTAPIGGYPVDRCSSLDRTCSRPRYPTGRWRLPQAYRTPSSLVSGQAAGTACPDRLRSGRQPPDRLE
jgi:hypothetical protein